ncbi:ABC transporter permease [Clostridium sp. AF18-27]|uniref:ABC transporter permease n=1 Tax=Enterocloster lavalensis TaxID=460384 RepID=UPI000E4C98AC|nr:ABC transporter permease [Enterocloster lavalensis]MBS5606830.1 ABC transporter permease [Enterocloster asparagiformis]MCB6345660.1 ABC transporter permease [Enterocloster lavalensis]RHR55169.1 ABC transporter permease [Clostridium sp. AF18-27]
MSAENQNMACMLLQDEDNEVVVGNQLRRMWYSFCKRKVAVLGLVIVLIYIIVAIFAPLLAPYDPVKQDLANMLQTPGPKHLLGTDEMGRDILSRIIYGARISMKVGFYAVGVAFVIGIPLGIFAGYFGGKVDLLIMRAMDVLLAFPGILLSIVFVSVLGPNLDNAILSVGIYTVPNFARMARGETLALRNSEFIEAARAMGSGDIRIVFSHILINIVSPMIVMGTLSFGTAIITTSGMGFLGIGAQPPTPEWGAMLSSGRQYLLVAPHVTTYTGLAILFLVLGLNLLGDGLRDVLDPKMKD